MKSNLSRRSMIKGMGAAALVAIVPAASVTASNTQALSNGDQAIIDHAAYIRNLLIERGDLIQTRATAPQSVDASLVFTREALDHDIGSIDNRIDTAMDAMKRMTADGLRASTAKNNALTACAISFELLA